MRHLLLLALLPWAATLSAAKLPNDSTGMAGDNFNLAGALELFRQAKDLDGFVQALNTSENGVNNLDLDADGQVDFVHVHAKADGEARVVILRVALAKDDYQDIAAIAMERTGEGMVSLQIIGDQALYPDSTIVEPVAETKEGGQRRGGPLAPPAQTTVWVNAWGWHCVQWIYGPSYWGWDYGWYWGYYPPWWNPYSVWGWNAWWGWPRPWSLGFRQVHLCRVLRAQHLYMMHRSSSAAIHPRVNRPRDPGTNQGQMRPGNPNGNPREFERTKPPARKPQPSTAPQRKPNERVAPPTPSRTAPSPKPAPKPSPAPSRSPGPRR